MKSLNINHKELGHNPKLKQISTTFTDIESNSIGRINWDEFSYKPKVEFKVFYSDSAIYIKYDVFEKAILANHVDTNGPVYQDSCVEFFISPGDGKYYNFEFNCIGTRYAASGDKRENREITDSKLVETIRTYSTLGSDPFKERIGDISWSLTAEIPFNLFTDKNIKDIKGSLMKANFYKCGDELSEPHFVSWNNIDTENPDFHRPEFFGEINFK